MYCIITIFSQNFKYEDHEYGFKIFDYGYRDSLKVKYNLYSRLKDDATDKG